MARPADERRIPPGLSYCAGEVRRQDFDRYLTALFAPADRREDLFALYAFNLEVARVREMVREPMAGLIRLQWWRETVEALHAGAARGHPVAGPLAAAIARRGLSRGAFERLLAAREQDMEAEPPADLPALLAYAEGSSASLVELALEILAEPPGAVPAALRAAGREIGIGYALVGLLRAVPMHAAARRVYIPAALGERHGLSRQALFSGRSSTALAAAAREIAAVAGERLARADRQPRPERRFLPALLPATLARLYLRRLEVAGYDVHAPAVQIAPPGRIWRLAARYALGRY